MLMLLSTSPAPVLKSAPASRARRSKWDQLDLDPQVLRPAGERRRDWVQLAPCRSSATPRRATTTASTSPRCARQPRLRESDVFKLLVERDVLSYAEATNTTSCHRDRRDPHPAADRQLGIPAWSSPPRWLRWSSCVFVLQLRCRTGQPGHPRCAEPPLAVPSQAWSPLSAPEATDVFVAHRNLLFTVAYEMLGSAADAEDVLQETWLRWVDVDRPRCATTGPTWSGSSPGSR